MVFCAFFITSCGTFGSKTLPASTVSFNEAAVRSKDEQMLLNIVRLRYSDRPMFIKLNSIATQLSLQSNFGMNIAQFKQSTGFSQFGLSYIPSVQYYEQPTITFTPLQGQKFTTQLLGPLEIVDIYSMIRSGWSVSRVFRLTVQEINQLHNAEGSTRSVSSYIPHYRDFMKFSYDLRKLHAKHLVQFRLSKLKGKYVMDLLFSKGMPADMAKAIGVAPGLHKLRLSRGRAFSEHNHLIHIETRSFLGIMHYLSKSVEIYPPHKRAGWAETTHYPNGKEFRWPDIARFIMHIKYAKHKPVNANVSIFYRGLWFYIDESDNISKETLALLMDIFAIKADDRSGNGPILTLPL